MNAVKKWAYDSFTFLVASPQTPEIYGFLAKAEPLARSVSYQPYCSRPALLRRSSFFPALPYRPVSYSQ
jgi:hypothetical protein